MFDLSDYFSERKRLIDTHLLRWIPLETQDPGLLHESMLYSIKAPGKRIRPILTLAVAETLGLPIEDVIPLACSLEMIHVFSLIHDDLPAMDNDDLRRGQPTNHKIYGEGLAILAGDNLLAHAFVPLTELNIKKYSCETVLKLIKRYALSTGSEGMIAGQVIDIQSEGQSIELDRLKRLHQLKTGALISLAVESPAILADVSPTTYKSLMTYGASIGLAFQIADDILDIEGGVEIGKNIGSDIAKGKSTYPSLMGLDGAKNAARKTLDAALDALLEFDERADPLREIARFIVERKS